MPRLPFTAEQEKNFTRGKADWGIIKKVKEAVNIPVIGNGDVDSLEKAESMFQVTGCDAIMIGRASLGNPWIFKEITQGEKIEKTPDMIKSMIKKHLKMLVAYKGEYTAIREMRKHIAWYIKGMENATEMRRKVNEIENLEGLEKLF